MTPDPQRIASHGRSVANLIADHGQNARKLAELLASVGYRTSTLGDGSGSKGADSMTAPERAALMADHPGLCPCDFCRWRLVDSRLDALLDLWNMTGTQLGSLVTDIVAHAKAEGLRPPPNGSGDCRAECGRYCSGAAGDRLRSGFCDPCRKAWERAGRPDRATFKRLQRAQDTGDVGDVA